jgi:hypothetical protein
MKLQNILRMQVAVMAIGAALLLAGAARAQEIDNPTFDEGPNSVPFTQASPAPAAAVHNAATTSPAAVAVTVATDPALKNNVVLSGVASSEGRMIAAIALCLALAMALLRALNRRRSDDRLNDRAAIS